MVYICDVYREERWIVVPRFDSLLVLPILVEMTCENLYTCMIFVILQMNVTHVTWEKFKNVDRFKLLK